MREVSAGIQTISDRIIGHVLYLAELLRETPGIDIVTDTSRSTRMSGILTFDVPGGDNTQVQRQMMEAGVACAERGFGVRLSPHFYTAKSTLDQTVRIVRQIIHEG